MYRIYISLMMSKHLNESYIKNVTQPLQNTEYFLGTQIIHMWMNMRVNERSPVTYMFTVIVPTTGIDLL